MNPKYLIGGLIVAVFGALAFSALDESKLEYCSIGTAVETGRMVQIKGQWVKEQGADYDSRADRFVFTMSDAENKQIKVIHAGSRPNNFDLAESIVVKGRVKDGVLHSEHILTKCPSKYEGGTEHLEQANAGGA